MIHDAQRSAPSSEDPTVKRRRREAQEEAQPDFRVLVPDDAAGIVIGRQGATLKRLRERYGVSLNVMAAEEPPCWPGSRILGLHGGTANTRALALEHVLSQLVFRPSLDVRPQLVACKVLVPAARVSHVIGAGGSILSWLHEHFRVHPVLDSNEVAGHHLLTLTGLAGHVLEAAKQTVALLDAKPEKSAELPGEAPPT